MKGLVNFINEGRFDRQLLTDIEGCIDQYTKNGIVDTWGVYGAYTQGNNPIIQNNFKIIDLYRDREAVEKFEHGYWDMSELKSYSWNAKTKKVLGPLFAGNDLGAYIVPAPNGGKAAPMLVVGLGPEAKEFLYNSDWN